MPPVVNQFSHTLEKSVRKELFKLLEKYRPETRVEKRQRLKEIASQKVQDKEKPKTKKPHFIKYGVNHVTALIEANAAKLVVIAHDVDPLEVIFSPPRPLFFKCVNDPYLVVFYSPFHILIFPFL